MCFSARSDDASRPGKEAEVQHPPHLSPQPPLQSTTASGDPAALAQGRRQFAGPVGDSFEMLLDLASEFGAFRSVLAQKAVGVLAGAAVPRAAGKREQIYRLVVCDRLL